MCWKDIFILCAISVCDEVTFQCVMDRSSFGLWEIDSFFGANVTFGTLLCCVTIWLVVTQHLMSFPITNLE